MKKTLLLLATAVLLFSCGNREQNYSENTLDDELMEMELADVVDVDAEETDVSEELEVIEEESEEPIMVEESSTNSSEWDKVLDDYESMIDSYAKIAEKSKSGDMSAIADLTNYMSKLESISSKLDGAESDLTPAQATRFVKLQAKMAKVAATL